MISNAPPPDEQWVLDLWQWLGRILQYSVHHPACVAFGVKAHERLTRALLDAGTLNVGILRDSLTVGSTRAANAMLRTRMGPYFHERGVILLRFLRGVTLDEMTTFMTAAALPTTEVFTGGGLRLVLAQRNVMRVQVEEISHDLLEQEREADRRQTRLRDLFLEMLKGVIHKDQIGLSLEKGGAVELLELLDEPRMLARLLESAEPPRALAQVMAGFADMVQEAEEQSGRELLPKLRALLLALGPEARDRLLLGYAALDEAARAPLGKVLAGFDEQSLALLSFPSVRYHALHLDRLYYALRAIVPDAGRRISVLRRISRLLHDLPLDEPATLYVMEALSQPPTDTDPFRFERAVLSKIAARIHADRAPFRAKLGAVRASDEAFREAGLDPLDHRVTLDIVTLGSKIVDFAQYCERLPRLADMLVRTGRGAAATGIFRALVSITDPRWQGVTAGTLRALAASDATLQVLVEMEHYEADRLDELTPLLRIAAGLRPEPLIAVLEKSENRKLRRVLIEALATAGPAVLSLAKRSLGSREWYVVRNMVTLLGRAGGTASDLLPVANHPQVKVRIEIARTLRGLVHDATSAQILASYLSDPAEEVHSAALVALTEVGLSPPAVSALEALVLDERRSDETRKRGLDALGRSRLDLAAHALFRLLEPRGILEMPFLTALRERAAVALIRSEARAAHQLFEQARQTGSWRARKACERAIEASRG